MDTSIELLEKRQEVKDLINARMNRTPMAQLLNAAGSLLGRVGGGSNSVHMFFRLALLGFLVALPTLIVVSLFNEWGIMEPIKWVGVFIVLEGFCFSILLAYYNVRDVLLDVRDFVVDSMKSTADLTDLQQWLSLGWSSKLSRNYLLGWTASLSLVAMWNMYDVLGGFPGFGLSVWAITFLTLSGISWSYAPLMMLFSIRLSKYEFVLHEIDPSNSEIISRITGRLNFYAYRYAINAAIVQLIFAAVGQFYLLGISAALLAWVPLTIQFVLNQTSMRDIIVASKWKTLNRIQAELKELHSGNLRDTQNIETILRLMDYHERVRATPNSTLNVKSVFGFLNQLTIPLIGIVVSNIETILNFLF